MNTQTLLKQISFILVFLVLSWILIHFLALFGLFLALSLPLLHLVFYPHIMCFWCRLKGSKHRLAHSLIDSALILCLTLISVPIVYFEYRLVSNLVSPVEIAKVAQFTIPSRSQYKVGEIFPVKIELMNIPSAINVAQADLSFDPKIVEVVDIDDSGSFVDFFVQKEHSNELGYIRVTGGVANPGYRSPTALLATAYLRGISAGAVELRYLESSLVLANNGRGDNLLADFPTIPLIITPAGSEKPTLQGEVDVQTQVQGDRDTTVLTFTEYAHDLPKPFHDTLGDSTTATSPAISEPAVVSQRPHLLLTLDRLIVSLWETFGRAFAR